MRKEAKKGRKKGRTEEKEGGMEAAKRRQIANEGSE